MPTAATVNPTVKTWRGPNRSTRLELAMVAAAMPAQKGRGPDRW